MGFWQNATISAIASICETTTAAMEVAHIDGNTGPLVFRFTCCVLPTNQIFDLLNIPVFKRIFWYSISSVLKRFNELIFHLEHAQ